jgi:putative flippase GtrA
MKDLISSAFKARFVRFLFSGGVNTIVSYSVYLIGLQFFSYQVSYTIAYVTGIMVAFLLNKLFVFESSRKWSSIILFPVVYIAQYIFGIFFLWLLISQLGMKVELGPLVVAILTIPLTYWLSALVFVGKESNSKNLT